MLPLKVKNVPYFQQISLALVQLQLLCCPLLLVTFVHFIILTFLHKYPLCAPNWNFWKMVQILGWYIHWVSKEPQRSPEAPIKYLEGTLISLVHTVPQDYLLTIKIESFIFSCLFIFRHQKNSEDFEFLLAQNQDLLVFCNLRS